MPRIAVPGLPTAVRSLPSRVRALPQVVRKSSIIGRARFEPARLGPKWRAADQAGTRIELLDGPLRGRTLTVEQQLQHRCADFVLLDDAAADGSSLTAPAADRVVGCVQYDRDPGSGLETIWDIAVVPGWQGFGIGSLLVRLSIRRLLSAGRRRWFAIRKLMKVDPDHPELDNVGIGLVAVRLGLRPEPRLEQLLSPCNIKDVKVLSAAGQAPPGLALVLDRMPGVLVAVRLDPGTGRPLTSDDSYRRFLSPRQLAADARSGRALIGNIDYVLARDTARQFAQHVADSSREFRQYRHRLHPVLHRQPIATAGG